MATHSVSAPLTTTSSSRGAYRPDIDGLRAFSILSVIVFHAFPQTLPGGFIGVDVFFVISGFLITGIILRSLSAETFSYATFYSRRIKRIFPALIVVLAASLLAGWLFLFHDEWKLLGKHLFSGAAFISNIALMREGGYFDSATKPLLHLWSLGIEEQFYIAWPLLLAFVWKRRSTTLPFIALVLLLSFALNMLYVGGHPSVVFYFPATRFWELAVGALLAHVTLFHSGLVHRLLSHHHRVSSASSIAGLVLLASSTVLIDENRSFPGAWALLPTTGAFLTIAAGPKAWFNRVVLSSRPMVFFGLISYPLYLWHWPILVFAKILNPTAMSWPLALVAIVTSIALSFVTYKLVETPLRHHRSAVVPYMLVLSVGAIGLAGLGSFCTNAMRSRLQTSQIERFWAATKDWDYPFGSNYRRTSGFQAGQLGDRGGEVTMFVGDSHAEQYYSRVKALKEYQPDQFTTTMFLTCGGCPPLPRVNRIAPGHACDRFFEYAMAMAARPEVRTIVFSGYWELYFGYGDSSSVDSYRIYRTGGSSKTGLTKRSEVQFSDSAFNELGSSIRTLKAHGKKVFVILSNPHSRLYDPRRMISRISALVDVRNVKKETLENARPILERLTSVAVESGATVIDPVPYLCGGSICRTTSEDGLPLYKDGDHLRSSFAACHATFVDQIYKE